MGGSVSIGTSVFGRYAEVLDRAEPILVRCEAFEERGKREGRRDWLLHGSVSGDVPRTHPSSMPP
eukprot:41438-Eustigmatos_ZCMA.PRE.1